MLEVIGELWIAKVEGRERNILTRFSVFNSNLKYFPYVKKVVDNL